MLYYNFKNYEEFKEIFGIVEHGNGVKSRRNKILLALYKDKGCFKMHVKYREYTSVRRSWQHADCRLDKIRYDRHYQNNTSKNIERCERINDMLRDKAMSYEPIVYEFCLLQCTELPVLKRNIIDIMSERSLAKRGCAYNMELNGKFYHSDAFRTDDMNGLCEDGTLNAIRYVNIEKGKVFKMKAGRMFNHLLECNTITSMLPEQIKRWMSEEWVADWVEYARENISECVYELHVDDNFEDIYDSDCCAGYDEDSDSFGSCMVNDDQWTFYRDAVDAKAAYLTDESGLIFARCIIYTNVTDQDGKKWRLAERQYSKFCDQSLQRQLIIALIKGGYIDGYKCVGASCHDPRKFVDTNGESLSDREFRIPCHLEDEDTISYQDSFKWFDYDEQTATNYGHGDIDLATTEGEVSINNHENDCWSSWNGEYISEEDAYWVETRNDYFYERQVVRAYVYNSRYDCYDDEWCFNDDCVEIDGDCYYAGEDAREPSDYGIHYCPKCDNYFVPGRGNSCYSDLTEEDYCCSRCMEDAEQEFKEENWTYAEYDDEYVEDEDDVTFAMVWNNRTHLYVEKTIKCETLDELMDSDEAVEIDGVNYIDTIGFDGEPVHFAAAEICAA